MSRLFPPLLTVIGLALMITSALVACGSGEELEPGPDAGDGIDSRAAGEVPVTADMMFAFLVADDYREYAAESAVHVSAGPHGSGGVRTFVNPLLAASLAAGNSEHPVGAAAIKELYASDGVSVSGWAAEVKTAAGAGGGTWYWYEVFSTTDGSRPIQGNGNSICTGCHSSGADFVRVAFPLQ